jgi:hypothetical protein
VLWAIKAVKSISVVFPMMVVGTCFVRKAIEKIFSMDELKWLDDLMPEDSRKKKEEDKMKDDEEHTEEVKIVSCYHGDKCNERRTSIVQI